MDQLIETSDSLQDDSKTEELEGRWDQTLDRLIEKMSQNRPEIDPDEPEAEKSLGDLLKTPIPGEHDYEVVNSSPEAIAMFAGYV